MNSQRPKAQLPSGLGAGGRGKEKAPCRYPHYEVYGAESKWEERHVKKFHRFSLGLGSKGAFESPVSLGSLIYES